MRSNMAGTVRAVMFMVAAALVVTPGFAAGADEQTSRVFRLYEGVTFYVVNSEGKDFTISLDVRDINLMANGPREVLFKVYDPDGQPVVREVIPDDGCATANATATISPRSSRSKHTSSTRDMASSSASTQTRCST